MVRPLLYVCMISHNTIKNRKDYIQVNCKNYSWQGQRAEKSNLVQFEGNIVNNETIFHVSQGMTVLLLNLQPIISSGSSTLGFYVSPIISSGSSTLGFYVSRKPHDGLLGFFISMTHT